MHIKQRRGRALLYRSEWVPRGAEGNTHGFARQLYVGSIAAEAMTAPEVLRERSAEDEVAFVEDRVCRPTRDRIADHAGEWLRVVGDQAKPRGGSTSDPLAEASPALRSTAQAVAGGRYGKAPAKECTGSEAAPALGASVGCSPGRG